MQARLDHFHKFVRGKDQGKLFGCYYKPFQHDLQHEKMLIEAYREYLEAIGHRNPKHLTK